MARLLSGRLTLSIPVLPPGDRRPLWLRVRGPLAVLLAHGAAAAGLLPEPSALAVAVAGVATVVDGSAAGALAALLAVLGAAQRGLAPAALVAVAAGALVVVARAARGLRPASPDALQARLNSVFEYGADVVALLDRQGRVLHASRSTVRVLGHELSDFVGRSALEFVHPEDHEAALRGFAESLDRPGVPLAGRLRMRHRGGEWRILEGVAINHLADPNVAALVVNYRDVTERHAAERALQASEERYRDLVERSLAGVYVTDFSGRMLSCNLALARMLGHESPDEVIGRQDTEFMAEPQLRLRTLARLQERGSLVGFEAALLKKGGQPLWVLGSANLVRGPDGAPRLVEGTLIEVTERRRAEEQARDLDKLKRNFMTVASHEMRSPLTVILGYVEMLLDLGLDPLSVRQRQFLEICRGSLDRIATIVNNMTRILAVEESRVRLARTAVDLRRLLDDVVREVAPFVERRAQRLIVEGPASVIAEADAGKVRTALQALVENAIKFTPDGGAIAVSIASGEDEVRIDVVDEGIGIEANELPLVFEKFYAGADPTHHSSGRYQFKARGPGLGLAIAKGYVEAHGGRIWVESRGSGTGAAFHVVLPRRAPLAVSASAA